MRKPELEEILEPIQDNQRVQMMKQFIQHGKTSTFQHCRSVAETCDWLNERFRFGADKRALITAAMLHDFYLYDWHCVDDGSHRRHGFHHARRARDNAVREFDVDIRIQSAIDSHMWPLNPLRVPRSREAWILWVADKIVTFREMQTGGIIKSRTVTSKREGHAEDALHASLKKRRNTDEKATCFTSSDGAPAGAAVWRRRGRGCR